MIALVIITIAIFSLATILIRVPKTKDKTNFWFAIFLLTADMGYSVTILEYYILPETNDNVLIKIAAQFISAFGFRFSPYFFYKRALVIQICFQCHGKND